MFIPMTNGGMELSHFESEYIYIVICAVFYFIAFACLPASPPLRVDSPSRIHYNSNFLKERKKYICIPSESEEKSIFGIPMVDLYTHFDQWMNTSLTLCHPKSNVSSVCAPHTTHIDRQIDRWCICVCNTRRNRLARLTFFEHIENGYGSLFLFASWHFVHLTSYYRVYSIGQHNTSIWNAFELMAKRKCSVYTFTNTRTRFPSIHTFKSIA